MKFCLYTRPQGEIDYSKFFREGEPIEVHLKSRDWRKREIYLVKKHRLLTSDTHASIDNDYKVVENYTGNDFTNDYRPARRHFLWLNENEIIWLTSNVKAKHMLERWDD